MRQTRFLLHSITLLSLCAFVFACHKGKAAYDTSGFPIGLYVCSPPSQNTLPADLTYNISFDFKPDNSFAMAAKDSKNSAHVYGRFSVTNQTLILRYDPNNTIVMHFDKTNLTTVSGAFPPGLVFVKNEK